MKILFCGNFHVDRFVFREPKGPDRTPELPLEGPPADSGTRQEGSLQDRMEAQVARGQKALARASELRRESGEISKSWKDAKEEAPGGEFTGGETVRLSADRVNARNIDTGRVIGTLRMKSTITVASDPNRVEVNGVDFVAVNFGKGEAYVAERYLEKTVPQKVSEAEKAGERVEILEGEMLEEAVLARAARQFPDKNPKDAWDTFAALYRTTILDKGLKGSDVHDAEQAIYQEIFGSEANIYEDKINRAFELAAEGKGGKLTEEVEVVKSQLEGDAIETTFTELLGKLGYEIGVFYNTGPMTGEQIREAFNLQSAPKDWGIPGSKITFDYLNGGIHVYVPEQEAVAEVEGAKPGESVPAVAAQDALHMQATLNTDYKEYGQMHAALERRRGQKSAVTREAQARWPATHDILNPNT